MIYIKLNIIIKNQGKKNFENKKVSPKKKIIFDITV